VLFIDDLTRGLQTKKDLIALMVLRRDAGAIALTAAASARRSPTD
jgi:hypothetical protein